MNGNITGTLILLLGKPCRKDLPRGGGWMKENKSDITLAKILMITECPMLYRVLLVCALIIRVAV